MNKKNRFMFLAGVILLLGFISTSMISYYVAHDTLSAQIEDNTLPLTSDNIYSEIQQDLLRPIFISSLMAQDTFLRDWIIAGEKDAKQVTRYLKEIQQRYDTITSFFVANESLSYYHPNGNLKTLSPDDPQDAWYFELRQSLPRYEVNVDIDTANPDTITVFINYKVYDYKGNFIGITGVGLSTATVKKLIDEYQLRYNREIFFVDRLGKITMHGPHYEGGDTLQHHPQLASFATRILTSPSSSFHYKVNNNTTFLSSRLVPEFDWYLIVKQIENPAETKIFQALIGNLFAALALSAVVLLLAGFTINSYQSQLEKMASTDKLTGLANRQVFDTLYRQLLKSSKRQKQALSLIMLDIDHFKRVNDQYGHPIGDVVLRHVSHLMQQQIRESDLLCRWGGEEFLLLLPQCSQEQAIELAEKIRQSIKNAPLVNEGHLISITLSAGVSERKMDEDQADFIKRCDQHLLMAKHKGRDRIEAG